MIRLRLQEHHTPTTTDSHLATVHYQMFRGKHKNYSFEYYLGNSVRFYLDLTFQSLGVTITSGTRGVLLK